MKLLRTAITRGFLTQVVAWGLYFVLELEFLQWMINPGFELAKIAGDTFSLAMILLVNWFIFTVIWLVLLVGAQVLFPSWAEEKVMQKSYDPHRGYYEE